MKTRLALVAARGRTEGPWMRSRGNETGIRVRCLGEGEHITVEMEYRGIPMQPLLYAADGVFDLPKGWERLRVHKHCPEDDGPHTHVDLLVNHA